MDIKHLFNEINKAWYVDDDIRCEDTTDIENDVKKILKKYKNPYNQASNIYNALLERWYLHEEDLECRWFIYAYLLYNK